MLNVVKLNGQLVNNRIVVEEPVEKLSQRIVDGDVIVVQNCFNKQLLLDIRSRIHKFGVTTPEGNPPRDAKTIDFHRIDNNHPKMAVKRIAHFFRFSYANKGETGVFQVMEPINYLRNAIAGLPEDYSFYEDTDGYLSQPAVLHYPLGGGYLEPHMDPVFPQFCELVLLVSQKGIDFTEGGLQIKSGDEWVDVESMAKFGDIVLFKPDIPHRVTPIDPHKELEWTSEGGRWIVFSPIANIRYDEKNEKALKDGVSKSYW
jgi:hypothetical protein